MYPTLFKIGFLEIHTYGVFVALGFFVGFKMLLFYGKKSSFSPALIEKLTFLVFIFSLIGARLFYVLISFGEFAENPLDIFKVWQGGLVFWGGFLGGAITVIIFSIKHKMPLWKLADVFAPALAIGHALGRIGCFFAGCCYGKNTDSFLGVVFPENCLAPTGIKLVPTQILSSILLLILFLILVIFWKRKKFDGQIFFMYTVLLSVGRFLIEFLRGDFRGNLILGITPTQIVSVVMFIVSIIIWKKLSPIKKESV
ncbi:MAG: prolipoprotein diacylglyceryl transferase [Elusimicrobia bacterium HGW-Elusimicrobia-4]|nr:MAG: prolipoprotein diacylglyceryl transferase [Elusimicrobia bacterium HGW-Elusimicrobia-4]